MNRASDYEAIKAALIRHSESSHVSLDQHVRDCQIALAKDLEERKAVYLDIKFWITLRNAAVGKHPTKESLELLTLARSIVATGKAFCPISESTFAELHKQEDPVTRNATALLIDELSMGVTLIPFDERVRMEIQKFVDELGGKQQDSHRYLVWSKLSYVLGKVHPTKTGFSPSDELMLQKAFFDQMWTTSLAEIVATIGERLPPGKDRFEALATRLNVENALHAAELRSFQQTYVLEIRGAIDLFAASAADIVRKMEERASGRPMSRDGAEWEEYVQKWKEFLISEFKKDPTKDVLRTMHINACLHAAIRWNKKRQLEANDFYDFHHAAAALGYCDFFLTERSLKAMLTTSNIALDKRFACEIAASIPDAMNMLSRI